MIFKVEINTQTEAGKKAYELIESFEDKEGITYLEEEIKEESVKIIEINSQTKFGEKAYEFIESNCKKEGITYLDLPECLTHKELRALEKEFIQSFEEIEKEYKQKRLEKKIARKYKKKNK
jgi:hypothetical protein